MSVDAILAPTRLARRRRALPRPVARLLAAPELLGLLGLTAALNLWGLGVNGWANAYYSAAVRSMSTSWHDFLFVSLDKSGLMTVDKPPLSLWVQALSARLFGFHPLSLLIPQALMGVVAVGLVYDLTRRRFGRPAGLIAGLALASTPVTVAVSRHNNPDELLVLCSVAAAWCALRALETRGTRWLVLSGVAVGLGFETKMAVALMVVPGIAAAWIWTGARGLRNRLVAVRQLLAGGVALVAVGGAWPLLVAFTPASDRPWISGTGDNNILSLIFGYNGLGRLAGQSGGPGAGTGPGAAGGGTMFGGATGPFRLLQSGLGDQAGWLLGFALLAALAILISSRLRREDQRTGWLIVIGGALLCSAVAFSFAQGIFHPYYVALLAPFVAALVGAGARQIASGGRAGRALAPLALGAGTITELVVLSELGGALSWALPLLVAAGAVCGVALVLELAPRTRLILVAVALAALLAAPTSWAVQTLGHATNGTFPTGGPASASRGAGAGPGGRGGVRGRPGAPPPFLAGASSAGASNFPPPPSGGAAGGGGFPGAPGGPGAGGFPAGNLGPPGVGGGPSGPDSASLDAAVRYAATHGGGTIGVSSQSSAAAAIVASNAPVAGLGGFSGRESSVSARWLAAEIGAGRLRWVIVDGASNFAAARDTRRGSAAAIKVAEAVCRTVTFTSALSGRSVARTTATAPGASASVTMYDCLGRSAALLRASGR